jgi:putative transposase
MSLPKFQDKYRIPSARLQNWDYRWISNYFITICTQNREHFFGKIENGKMNLNQFGQYAAYFWSEIPNHFPNVDLGNFVVMPNHVHGVLMIHSYLPTDLLMKTDSLESRDSSVIMGTVSMETVTVTVETLHATSLPLPLKPSNPTNPLKPSNEQPQFKNEKMSEISPKSGSISTIIRSYKSVVTKNIREINPNFQWQSRFHDHIIRNEKSFHTIQNYIEKNPLNWSEDKFYSGN